MPKALPRITVAAALVAIPLAACGGGSSTASKCGAATTTTPSIEVHALDSLKFDKSEFAAKAGDVTIKYVDDGSLPHTLLVRDKGCKLALSGRGDSKTGTVNLTPGTYEIYCDVPGHESAGMRANLVVS